MAVKTNKGLKEKSGFPVKGRTAVQLFSPPLILLMMNYDVYLDGTISI